MLTFGAFFRIWLRLGLLSFGGPAAQIALIHRVVVEEQGWMRERSFLNALNFCLLLPGPEAMQLATYAGWQQRGLLGGLVAGGLFVLPGALLVLGLSWAYAIWGQLAWALALFAGIKAAVVALVVQALIRLMGRALKQPVSWLLALFAFLALFLFALPYPLVILVAGLVGAFALMPISIQAEQEEGALPSFASTLAQALVWLVLWLGPIFLTWLLAPQFFFELARFFSRLAVVTFGGAYAVLAYMVQDVVQLHGWLSPEAMLDGLGLAESTPGPLILVTEFVGFMAGYGQGGWAWGLAAAGLTLWVTFVPCFLWIFIGAPYVGWLARQPRLSGALAGISAAVVGVILNLSLWFTLRLLFDEMQPLPGLALEWPRLSSLQVSMAGLIALGLALVLWRRWGLLPLFALLAGLGLALGLLGWL